MHTIANGGTLRSQMAHVSLNFQAASAVEGWHATAPSVGCHTSRVTAQDSDAGPMPFDVLFDVLSGSYRQ
jgi:hypothetical protein